jgi:hypothetical protein
MSLTVGNGLLTLSFHPPGELTPSWRDLQDNASLIEDYLEQLNFVAAAIEALEKK